MKPKVSLFVASISIAVSVVLILPLDILQNFQYDLGMKYGKEVTSTHSSKAMSEDGARFATLPKVTSIPVLMYHSISTVPGNSLCVPVKQFTEEMEWLHRQNYRTLTMDEFYQILANKAPLPEKPILITFDDGNRDNYTTAWPILRQNGIKATFFVVSSYVGPGRITWDELGNLVRDGNSIGSHTVHHLNLASLNSRLQELELSRSKQEIENHLGINVLALCFPSGRYNSTTLGLMPKSGYKLGFTTKPGRVRPGHSLLELRRVRIYGGMSLAGFKAQFP